MPKPQTLEVRFWSRVDKRGSDDCWLWLGAKNRVGYAIIAVVGGRGGKCDYVHRVSYRMHYGAIPDGKEIDHLCKVKHCVNPKHLEAVTHRTNILRSNAPPGLNARRKKCKRGHNLSGANLYVLPCGARRCKACHHNAYLRHYRNHRNEFSTRNALYYSENKAKIQRHRREKLQAK